MCIRDRFRYQAQVLTWGLFLSIVSQIDEKKYNLYVNKSMICEDATNIIKKCLFVLSNAQISLAKLLYKNSDEFAMPQIIRNHCIVDEGIEHNNDIGRNSDILYPYCLLYTSPSPRDRQKSRMPSSA
eukprot:TRINITY_DN4004_c0_g1_i1.p1 TRINITY_DN4004_c0_g1~~TRINITY_DN4004_c0_g1_i1.p1  ORF type:complete len:127 (-),score=28.29 TRINITY_DN4004_c0_g1_i1:12-392(-)